MPPCLRAVWEEWAACTDKTRTDGRGGVVQIGCFAFSSSRYAATIERWWCIFGGEGMPIYEYRCKTCGELTEVMLKIQ